MLHSALELVHLLLGTVQGLTVPYLSADLARSTEPVPEGLEVDFVRASSYQGTASSSTVTLHVPGSLAVTGRHVLLVRTPAVANPQ